MRPTNNILLAIAFELLMIALLLSCLVAEARPEEFPNAPSHLIVQHNPIELYSPDERLIVHNSPSRPVAPAKNLDWRFLAAHGAYAGSVAFDDYVTARGLGRPCGFSEGNPELGSNPSAGKLAWHGAVEFSLVTAMDYLLKRTHAPGLSYVGAVIGTAKHIHGGYQWTQTGCL